MPTATFGTKSAILNLFWYEELELVQGGQEAHLDR